jgi:hypothetical protein
LTPTLEVEGEKLLEREEDLDSIFSGFSKDADDTESLPSIGKANGPFSQHVFKIEIILGQRARISTVIRQSSARYRYQTADASLEEQLFEDLKQELTNAILVGNIVAKAREPVENFAMHSRVTDPIPEFADPTSNPIETTKHGQKELNRARHTVYEVGRNPSSSSTITSENYARAGLGWES